MECLLFVGVAAIICSGIIFKEKTKMFAGEPAPFVMELSCISLANRWKRTPAACGSVDGLSSRKQVQLSCYQQLFLWFLMNFGWSNGTFGMLDFDGLEGAALEAAQAECVLAKNWFCNRMDLRTTWLDQGW